MSRGQCGLVGFSRLGAVDGDGARDAVLGCQLQQLGEDVAYLLLRHRAGEQRNGLTRNEGDDHGDRLRAEALGDLRVRIHVDLGQHQTSGELGDDLLEDRAELRAGTAPLGPQIHHDRHGPRQLEHLTEALVGRIEDQRRAGAR